ncbi:hypothetical protein [Cytophaga aurantiaca]|uniref:hypothetical protein n=1 Tax=Cytophaga aurantiaca TaxID=29530 RepID=UPI000360C701|nr:hypothetical protein [Cytophaga aurantiaca]
MKEESLSKPFKDITVDDIKQECVLVEDLLEVAKAKPSLVIVARLVASLIVEKTLRHILYNEYKTITKIKFSILIDKAYQKNIIDSETAIRFRALKEFRNASVHHGLMNITEEEQLMPINEIVQQIHILLDNFTSKE